jgi:hypothetical protein
MRIWVEHCFKTYVDTVGIKQLNLLMMDNFSTHQLKSVRDQLAEHTCILSLLPANMTSTLQILDVGINMPFKDFMKAQYTQFLIDSLDKKTNITRELMSTWIANSWESVKALSIVNTSRKIGFIS